MKAEFIRHVDESNARFAKIDERLRSLVIVTEVLDDFLSVLDKRIVESGRTTRRHIDMRAEELEDKFGSTLRDAIQMYRDLRSLEPRIAAIERRLGIVNT